MINDNHVLWVERYRPRKVQDCILPQATKQNFLRIVAEGTVPNLILRGSPGTGKTTVARAMCEDMGLEYIVINGSTERGIDTLRTIIKGYASTVSLSGGRKVIIVDEADNLTNDAQMGLRGVIEEVSGNCSFIFTCNFAEKIIEAIHSRCAVVPFSFNLGAADKTAILTEFFKRLVAILTTEKVKFDKKVVAELLKLYFPDYRRIINELQFAASSGEINEGALRKVSDATYTELFSHIKQKNYPALRKWVAAHVSENDTTFIMRGIFDRLSEHLEPASIPVAVILLGKYQHQAAFAADKEINLMAFLTEVLVECTLK